MLKVLIVNDDFNMGGIQRVTGVVGESLSEEKIAVTFYSIFSNKNFYNLKKEVIYGRKNINKLGLFISKIRKKIKKSVLKKKISMSEEYYHDILQLEKYIQINNYDVIIMNGTLLISWIPLLKTKIKNAKYIGWLHNTYEMYISKYSENFRNEFIEGMMSSDLLICLTEADKDKYIQFNPETVRIYNPITLTTKQLSNLKKPMISFTGRIVFEQKGIDYLLELAKKLPEGWCISVAGDGSDEEVNRFKLLINERQLHNKILFRGLLNGEELINHYVDSSIFISTSRWEGFGLVLLEAMAVGLPIVSFKHNGSEEILSHGKYGLISEQGDVNQLYSFIYDLIVNEDLRKKYSILSIERVKDFSINKIISQWEDEICKLGRDINE